MLFPFSHFLMLFDSLREEQGCRRSGVLGSRMVSVPFLKAAQGLHPGASLPAPFLSAPSICPLPFTGKKTQPNPNKTKTPEDLQSQALSAD